MHECRRSLVLGKVRNGSQCAAPVHEFCCVVKLLERQVVHSRESVVTTRLSRIHRRAKSIG